MSAWMKEHFTGYDPNKTPAVLMPEANCYRPNCGRIVGRIMTVEI
jgi:hypothetical protein